MQTFVGFALRHLAKLRCGTHQDDGAVAIVEEEIQRSLQAQALEARRELRVALFALEHALRVALSAAPVSKELQAELDELGGSAQQWANLVGTIVCARANDDKKPSKSKKSPTLWRFLAPALALVPTEVALAGTAEGLVRPDSQDGATLRERLAPSGQPLLTTARYSAAQAVGVALALHVRKSVIAPLRGFLGASEAEAELAAVRAGFVGLSSAGGSRGFHMPLDAAGQVDAYVLRAKSAGSLTLYTDFNALLATLQAKAEEAKNAKAKADEDSAAEAKPKKRKARHTTQPPLKGMVVIVRANWPLYTIWWPM